MIVFKYELQKLRTQALFIIAVCLLLLFSVFLTDTSVQQHIFADSYSQWLSVKVESDFNLLNSPVFTQTQSSSDIKKLQFSYTMYSRLLSELDTDIPFQNVPYFYNQLSLIPLVLISVLFGFNHGSFDYEKGVARIIDPTKSGQSKQKWIKLMTYSLILTLTVTVSLLLRAIIYPFDPSVAIQSVPSLTYSPYLLNLKQLSSIHFLFNVAGCLLLFGLSSRIIHHFKTIEKTALLIVFIISLEFLFFYSIPNSSPWQSLKFINIISLFDISQLFASFSSVAVFSFPIAMPIALIITTIIAVIIFSLAWTRNFRASFAFSLENYFNFSFRKPKSLLFYEGYKLMVQCGALVFIVLATFVFARSTLLSPERIFIDEFYYHTYARQLHGKINADTDQIIQDLEAEFDQTLHQLEQLEIAHSNGVINAFDYGITMDEIESKLTGYDSFVRIRDDYQKTKERQSDYFVNQLIYNKLVDSDYWRNFILIMSVTLLISIFLFGTIESSSGMKTIMVSIPEIIVMF